MTCAESHLLVHAYADGELDVVRSLEVEQHLKGCPKCAAQLTSLKALHTALVEGDFAYHAPASLRDKIRHMAPVPERKTERRPSDLQWFWKWLALGATTVAILTIILRPAEFSQSASGDELSSEVVACHVRSLMPGHLTDVLSSDKHTVKPWFAGKLDFAPDVKDFTTQSFPLVGGRLDYVNNRSVAALVYQHNKHLINVFIWPTSAATGGASEMKSYHGYYVISFNANGFHYSLVSDMDQTELKELAGLLGDQN
ncbi:MAG TPA: anti-sigma factor [Candidatus Acidoferrum sp.]|jgi:anti-sigma factor RsiW|nr:anti-sigma factor [Candidatus Acidoferrum sp.]